jgi:hypothetical protein
VVCDHCGRQIASAAEGNCLWRPDDPRARFVHKDCSDAFEEANGGRSAWCWMMLACFPVYLGDNLRLGWKRAREAAKTLERL